MNIEITVAVDEMLEYARQRLGNLYKKAPQAVKTALNDTAKEAKKQDEKVTKALYTAKKDINALQLKQASTGNLQAILKDKGANISMTHFNHYAGKRVVSAIINKGHGRKRLGKNGNKAFFRNTIFVRKGASRLPIEKMASISSPVMHGNKQTWGKVEPGILQKLQQNVEKQVERILNA